jgi:hypothetical protein
VPNLSKKAMIGQYSKSLVVNYSRCLPYMALHSNRPTHKVSAYEINVYLYSMMVHQNRSITYFKHAVVVLSKMWFRRS